MIHRDIPSDASAGFPSASIGAQLDTIQVRLASPKVASGGTKSPGLSPTPRQRCRSQAGRGRRQPGATAASPGSCSPSSSRARSPLPARFRKPRRIAPSSPEWPCGYVPRSAVLLRRDVYLIRSCAEVSRSPSTAGRAVPIRTPPFSCAFRLRVRAEGQHDSESGAPPAASRPRPRSCRPSSAPRLRRAHRRPRTHRGAPWSRRMARR
jgi:hypothetical protein